MPGTEGHAGRSGTKLSLTQAKQVVDWVLNSYTRRDTVFVFKGAGSGAHSAKGQLKIVHKQVMDGPKHATCHISLKQAVYDGLVDVDEADA